MRIFSIINIASQNIEKKEREMLLRLVLLLYETQQTEQSLLKSRQVHKLT